MTRPEIYEAMGKERIIMFDQLQARLEQLTDDELIARWRGTVDLAFDYSPENRCVRNEPVTLESNRHI